ncbi:MAG: hypothetical protein O3C40_22015 [Planctomycetota bacterium]|nr:hypothetical protein [Planctomycetota bacterium]
MSNPYGDYSQLPQNTPGPVHSTGGGGGKAKAPAIGLIVCGAIDAAYGLLNMVTNLMGGPGRAEIPPDAPPFVRQFMEQMNNSNPILGGIFSLVMIAVGGLIVFGGVQMLKQRSYGLAMAASILTMLPCLTCLGCCGVGEGIGIWALVVLLNEDVKRSFR